ncbi:MAG: glycosyltransferase [Candidatus Moranbacteria bacterium]|jgi:glycosyltransferase involved in cell wall biosynthesis|nr:glycosyltransferase [Candidatus Moranbacteria bacterium]
MVKFSILIPIIKGKFLDKAIKSVLSQSFYDWQLVLYDDCSKDDIDKIVEKYSADQKVIYLKGKKNIGLNDPSLVWNKMLSYADGKYICLLGDDDFLSDNYLEEINKLILKYPETSVFRAKLRRVGEQDEFISEVKDLPEFETWDQLFYERNINKRMQSSSEFVLKKNSLEKIGGYVNFPRACGSDDATYLLLSKNGGVSSTNKTYAFWRKSSLNISDNDSQEVNEYKIKFLLNWERDFLDRNFPLDVPLSKLYSSIESYSNLEKLRKKDSTINTLVAELDSAKAELDSTRTELDSNNTKLDSAKAELDSTRTELDSNNTKLDSTRTELINVYNSREWKTILRLQKLFKFIFPVNSLRRIILVKLFRITKKIVKTVFKAKRKACELFLLSKNYLTKFKPRKRRKVNLKSKRLVYIGHSYHNKTKSTAFLIDYLKKFFDVEVVLDESWQGKPAPDLSFIDESYLGVIFFQLLPSREVIDKIKNDNIIYFPMYDQSGRLDYSYWSDYRDLKIANFSSTLHKKLKKWGFDSIYVQYFPDLQKFIPGKKDEVFFWQRLTNINISKIIKIFGKKDLKIHIHKAIDPDQKFMQPGKEDEDKFKITYSEWFDTREEMWDVIKQKGIYIAPREYEGIGMSFLEAMAMGKAVVAVNNPTMNEYIEHGKNGYLYDLNNPREIDLSSIEEVQRNTHKYMQDGYKKWNQDKKRVIDFIKRA